MHLFLRDLSFSIRSLRRNPGFTFVAVLTLTLGIAGTAVVFSLINATLLRPLCYPDAHRLVILRWQDQSDISDSAFFLVKNRARSLATVAALYPVNTGVNISASGTPSYVYALPVSKDFFPTLGVLPQIGATFSAEQDSPHSPSTAVLSHRLWTQSFNGQKSALGHDIILNGERHKIIGVMPEGFRSYPDADIWLPLQLDSSSSATGNNSEVIARLAPGVSRLQAQFELDGLAREYHSAYPWSASQGTLVIVDLQKFLTGSERSGLVLLFAAVAFVFVIACTNVAILMLVRATAKTQPTAIRAALGSTRKRLVFSLFTESILLSGIGGLLGLIVAKESLPLILYLWPAGLPLSSRLLIDWHVVIFTITISVCTSLLFGLTPAVKLSHVNLSQVLARASRAASAGAGQVRNVKVLVFGQMILTVILFAGTMLLVKSLLNLYSVPLGFDSQNIVVAQIALAGERYNSTVATNQLVKDVVNELEGTTGVESAAAVDGLPLQTGLNVPLHPVDVTGSVAHEDEYRPVSPGYFRTLRIPLRAGRFFSSSDSAGSEPVAIINEAMARRWWPNTTAVGHYIRVDEKLGPQPPDKPRQIVGIVSDIHEKSVSAPAVPTVFIPLTQTQDTITAFFNNAFLTSIVIRSEHGMDLSSQIRNAIQKANPELPVASLRPFNEIIRQSLAEARFLAFLTVVFSGFALLLTAVGIQGLLNYQAHLRTREIAIRMAVGASRKQIILMIVQQGTKVIYLAVLVGISGAFGVKVLLESLLFDLQGSSWVVILAAGVLLGSIANLISLQTAIRAASIEPMAVLRNE